MTTTTGTPVIETQSNTTPFQKNSAPESSSPPVHVENPTFNANCEASFKYAVSLAQQVVQDKLAGHTPTDIPADHAVNMAILVTDMIRMLNASGVSRDAILRAAAYMEGEERPKAGQALRQARLDRRNKSGYRRPAANGTAEANAVTGSDAEALGGVDPNTATVGHPTTSTTAKISDLDQENEKPKTEYRGNQVDPSTRKSKKKPFWNYRRHYPRKSKDPAAMDRKKSGEAGAIGVTSEPTAVANSSDQTKSVKTFEMQPTTDQPPKSLNSHTSTQQFEDNNPAGGKPDTDGKEEPTAPTVIVTSDVKTEDAEVKQVTAVTEFKAKAEHLEAVEPNPEPEKLEKTAAV
ncbi:hypothetical protein LTR84_013045 [Exophiala bonariae]|uniref:Uncharacterized protein n=1 Tax=Exophiala bonariae TaxID=1690606 RepID=A0AAV9NDU3_9EURO|nr:hypothetical protein LTR84_013045 [Exophiala bonariae]